MPRTIIPSGGSGGGVVVESDPVAVPQVAAVQNALNTHANASVAHGRDIAALATEAALNAHTGASVAHGRDIAALATQAALTAHTGATGLVHGVDLTTLATQAALAAHTGATGLVHGRDMSKVIVSPDGSIKEELYSTEAAYQAAKAAYLANPSSDPNFVNRNYKILVPDPYAYDLPNRTVAANGGNLGSASDFGGTWTVSSGTADMSVVPVVGGTPGYIYINHSAAAADRQAQLNSISVRDLIIKARFSYDQVLTAGGYTFYLHGRQQANNTQYRLGITHTFGSTTATIKPQGISAGSAIYDPTAVNITGITMTANNDYWLMLRLTGASPTTIEGWFWDANIAQPTNPQWSSTDSTAALQVAGAVGFNSRLGGTGTPLNFKTKLKEYSAA